MSFKIEKVAVLGTGVMGSQIAAHLTNAGKEVYAFDMSQEISEQGIEKAVPIEPAPRINIFAINYSLKKNLLIK